MANFKAFLGALAFIAFIAILFSSPKMVAIKLGIENRDGAPTDPGPWGHSILMSILEGYGYSVEKKLTGFQPQPGVGGVAIIIAGPTSCDEYAVSSLKETVRNLLENKLRVLIVVSDEGYCWPRIMDAVVGERLYNTIMSLDSPLLVETSNGLVAMYTASLVDASTAGLGASGIVEPLAVVRSSTASNTIPEGVEATVIIEASINPNLRIVHFTDSHVFTNTLMMIAYEISKNPNTPNLANPSMLINLLEQYGFSPEITMVVMPLEFYRIKDESINLVLKFHPGQLLLFLLNYAHEYELMMLTGLYATREVLFILIPSLAVILFTLFTRSMKIRVVDEEVAHSYSPVTIVGATMAFERFRKEGARITGEEAKRAFASLYEAVNEVFRARYGVGIKDVIDDPERLRAMVEGQPGAENLDLEEAYRALVTLHKLYVLKIEQTRFFPIVFSWKRKLYYVLTRLEPVLEVMGAGLRRGKGIERILH